MPSSGFPIPTRQESGVDIPVLGKTNSGYPISDRQESGVDMPALTPVLTDGVGSQLEEGPAGSPDTGPEGERRSSKPMEQPLVGGLLNGETSSQQDHIMVAAGGAPAKGESGSAGGNAELNLPDRESYDVFGPVLSEAVAQTPTSGFDPGGEEGDSSDNLKCFRVRQSETKELQIDGY